MKLNIGCGSQEKPGYHGVDIRPENNVEYVCDLEQYPWPWDDDSIDELYASHVAEHINPHKGNFIRWMDEAWRVLVLNGRFTIIVPDPWTDDYIGDPTHCNPCSPRTWGYFDPCHSQYGDGLYKIYHPKPWRVLECVRINNDWHAVLEKVVQCND